MALAVAAAALVATTGSPVAAHSVVNPMKSLRSEVVSAPRGVTATVTANGSAITVSSSVPLVVLGYSREPFLRFTGGHVEQNMNSLTTYDAQTGMLTSIPASAGHGSPRWRRLGGSSYAWSDHRTVWGGAVLPEAVTTAPKQRHVLSSWTIPVTVDGHADRIRGRVEWVPPRDSVGLTVAACVGFLALVLGLAVWAAMPRRRRA